MRRTGGRQPLHDPDAEGALVLFTPRELTEHERLKVEGGLGALVIVINILHFLQCRGSVTFGTDPDTGIHTFNGFGFSAIFV